MIIEQSNIEQRRDSDFLQQPVLRPHSTALSKEVTKQEGWRRMITSAVNCDDAPLESDEFNSVKPAGNDIEETELKEIVDLDQSPVDSATIKGTERPGSSPSPAEFIPRSLRERKRPAKYEDFDTQFVRTMRASQLHSDKPNQSSQYPYSYSRVIWNTQFNSEAERALITQSEVQQSCVFPRVRVLRQTWIETDQSASSSDDQSAAEFSSSEVGF